MVRPRRMDVKPPERQILWKGEEKQVMSSCRRLISHPRVGATRQEKIEIL